MPLFTIGHSNHKLPAFIDLLQAHAIETLVDVRSAPHSRFSPHFNKKALDASLPQSGIRYVFAGDSLGGRPTDPACLTDGKVDYAKVMQQDWFQQGIERLLEIAAASRTAIMCSEEDPANCHRHHLIARYLLASQPMLDIEHIRKDRSLISAQSLMSDERDIQLPLL
jgi:uncharacterized protein (DUF488 family)